VAWTLLHLGSVSGYLSLDSLGQLSNFRPPKTTATAGLDRLPIVTETVVALVAAILVLTALAAITLLRNLRSRQAWALALCPTIGLALIAINPYGQEAIFRAALFGLPWLAVLAVPNFRAVRAPGPRSLLLVTVAALAGTYLVSSNGLDAADISRPADVAAVRYPQEHGGTNYILLLLGQGDLPSTLRPGELQMSTSDLASPPDGPATVLTTLPAAQEVTRIDDLLWQRYLAQWQGPRPAVYAIWSPTQSAYQVAYGLDTRSRFAELRDAMSASPYWKPVLQRDGTVLYRFDVQKYLATVP
jgi:hypothetical protein